MIIQCDHCSARFRMDDSKLANGPVKVRCAKCKEVFVVKPEEPAVENVVPAKPVTAPSVAEGGGSTEFSFDAPAGQNSEFSQNSDDFSFDDEAVSASKAPASGKTESADEYDLSSGAAPKPDTSGSGSDFDLSSFEASLAVPGKAADVPSAVADDNDFDFGEVNFNSTNTQSKENPTASDSVKQDDFSMDFGEVSFSDPKADESGSPDTSPGVQAEDDSFISAASAQSPQSSVSDDFMPSFDADTPQKVTSATATTEAVENVNFGEFSFGDMGDSGATGDASSIPSQQETAADGFAAVNFSPEHADEELPPASLTSRKKGGSLFPLFVIVGAIILIIGLAGSGIYFFGGPKAFSRVGLGFLVDWYGDKGAEEGSIVLKGITASYAVNSQAGELFVVRGEAVNNFKKPRASIQIKVSLIGPGGTSLVAKSAYCGNSLSNEQLATLPLEKIEEAMNNQFGDSLANLGLKPGGTIPFVVVVSSLPKEATDYMVTVGGSTVATQ